MEKRLEILITNDDSINAEGINLLANIMKSYGNVTVVAPLLPQSGKSAALSLGEKLYLKETYREEGLIKYTFTGTPVDCIKIGINECLSGKKPDIIVSGINHGSNCSVASLYSGTLGACIEGTIYGVPSIGFSLNTHDPSPDFSGIIKYINVILDNFLSNPPATGVYLNVNFPNLPAEKITGIKFARRGKGMWVKEFETYEDPEEGRYFVMAGHFHNLDEEEHIADHKLVKQGYITIVPHNIDNTDYSEISRLSSVWKL
ncbi:MAG: 5'/3'-nucleotidase SurE [Bacteroidales bacterium]|nr:5'/3'-nucleotidase SurE [Bacteroidales bacterium]